MSVDQTGFPSSETAIFKSKASPLLFAHAHFPNICKYVIKEETNHQLFPIPEGCTQLTLQWHSRFVRPL
jgi:hypothetical protein